MSPESADDLLEQLGRGEVEALGELAEAYGPYLRAVVRTQLSARLRAECDSVDVVQSVWVQVIRRLKADGWRVNDAAHLRALLVTIARRRLLTRARRRGHTEPADDLTEVVDCGTDTPPAVAEADDLWGRLLRQAPPEHRRVLRLRRDGLSAAEIAARTGLHEGSVRRVLRQLARQMAVRPKGDV
jgi:RNA polymerase sigma factor (sigma-70 family)